jgi:DNA-binding transcriptional LysR family regulator
MDKLANMAMFVRVVDTGSFAAAAAEAGVSATMAGKHVRNIELRLGARLLHRTTRRQQLTDVGRLYYERCKQVLADIELAESSASELQATPRGVLRMTAPLTFGSRKLVPALTEYLEKHPEVSIELALDNRAYDLVNEGFELGLRIGGIGDDRLVARPLQPFRMLLAATPRYLARHGTPRTPEDLSAHNCISLSTWSPRDCWRLVGPTGDIEVAVKGSFTANNGEALRVAALADAGIVLQPEVLLGEDLQAGRLVHVLPDWGSRPMPMHLLYAQDRRPTAKLRSVIEFLVERFPAEG